jgi:aryl-alcohol dehydrogenase-like predicted oxidoreductase
MQTIEQRPLGAQGGMVSALGLGCMGMSEFYGAHDDTQSLDTLDAAVEQGITLYDSADTYGFGHNEELLGRWLKTLGSARRVKVAIATKFGIVRQKGQYERRIDNSPAYIRSACDASLQRLGVDCIDLYYCHRRNTDVPIEDMVGAMADLVRAGKVRAIGLSEVSAETLRRASAVHRIAAVQSEYSLWSREPEAEMLQLCRDNGTAFVAYSPLGRAFLTGTITSTDALAADDFRRNVPRFQEAAMERNRDLAARLAAFATERGHKPAQIALAWLLCKHPHVIPIPGTRRRNYLAENIAAASIKLNADDVAALDAMFPVGEAAGERYPEGGWAGIE